MMSSPSKPATAYLAPVSTVRANTGIVATMKHRAIVAVLLALPLWAHAQKSGEQAIVWQSRNETFEELTGEFASLYRDLLSLVERGGTLPTKTVEVPPGKTITEVLRSLGLFDGKYLPKQLDVLVCKLNPSVCTLRLGRSGNEAADDASVRWNVQPGEAIVVPAIEFTPIVLHKPYQKRVGDSLKKIVVDERRGCNVFDEACLKYVQNLNRRLDAPLDNAYGGKIVVPTKAYRAAIPVVRERLPNPSQTNSSSKATSANAPAALTPSGEVTTLVPAMSDRLIPPSKATLHATNSEATVEGSRALLLKLIKHPLSQAKSLLFPDVAKTTVAVFDSWVDNVHCMFKNVTVVDPDGLRSAIQRSSCGSRGSPAWAQDHGTHVVGLIASRLDAPYGPGINPYASIRAVSINTDSFKLPNYLAKQADQLRQLYRTDAPDVVNLSFEYTLSADQGSNDVFHAAMKDQERDTLFVVSAGNNGAPLSRNGDCRVRPACYDDMNVVTVGALDLSERAPNMMSVGGGASNYGDRVHLASPGQNIVSTISGDRIGVMNGTSQAAPVVAGAASLLYLYERRLRPSQVKNRLIYTSDLFPALYGKVQGGRLNVQRLLAYKAALVDLAGGRRLEGNVRDPNKTMRFVDFDSSEVVPLAFSQVRRLMLNAGLGHYTLFYTDEIGRDSGVLKRRFVTLKEGNATLSFGVPTAPGQPDKREEVRLKNIVDYVAPLQL